MPLGDECEQLCSAQVGDTTYCKAHSLAGARLTLAVS